MKYALFDFYEEGTTDIGPVSWIVDLDEATANNDDFDFEEEVEVQWRGSGSKKNVVQNCPARVLMFSDDKVELRGYEKGFLNNMDSATTPSKLGRGKRSKRRRVKLYEQEELEDHEMADVDDNDKKKEQQKKQKAKATSMKTSNKKLLHMIKKTSSAAVPDSEDEDITMETVEISDDDKEAKQTSLSSGEDLCQCLHEDVIKKLKEEVKKLRGENKHLHSALKSLEWLSSALPKLEKVMVTQHRDAATPNRSPPTPVMQKLPTPHSTSSSQTVSFGSKEISLSRLAKCDTTNMRKYTLDLMTAIFDRKTMITHTLSGTVANSLKDVNPKPALDKDVVDGIIDHVINKFAGTTPKEIKEAIKAKLNNEKKSYAKKNAPKAADVTSAARSI